MIWQGSILPREMEEPLPLKTGSDETVFLLVNLLA